MITINLRLQQHVLRKRNRSTVQAVMESEKGMRTRTAVTGKCNDVRSFPCECVHNHIDLSSAG